MTYDATDENGEWIKCKLGRLVFDFVDHSIGETWMEKGHFEAQKAAAKAARHRHWLETHVAANVAPKAIPGRLLPLAPKAMPKAMPKSAMPGLPAP